MNKTQRWNYEDLQARCDQIAAMGKVLVDFADGTLCDADPENVKETDIERADKIMAHLLETLSDEKLQEHCRKLASDPTEEWGDIFLNLPDLGIKPN